MQINVTLSRRVIEIVLSRKITTRRSNRPGMMMRLRWMGITEQCCWQREELQWLQAQHSDRNACGKEWLARSWTDQIKTTHNYILFREGLKLKRKIREAPFRHSIMSFSILLWSRYTGNSGCTMHGPRHHLFTSFEVLCHSTIKELDYKHYSRF